MGLFSAYSRLSRPKKGAIVAGILILLYAVLGFFIAPTILRSQFSSRISEHLGRPVTIEQVRMNPFALSLTVRGFELEEPAGGPFVGFEELYVNFQVSSLFRWAYTFNRIELIGPHGLVKVLPDGKEIRLSDSNWLRENTQIALNMPAEVIPRTPYVEVKIYTGALAQVIEGL